MIHTQEPMDLHISFLNLTLLGVVLASDPHLDLHLFQMTLCTLSPLDEGTPLRAVHMVLKVNLDRRRIVDIILPISNEKAALEMQTKKLDLHYFCIAHKNILK